MRNALVHGQLVIDTDIVMGGRQPGRPSAEAAYRAIAEWIERVGEWW